MGIVDSIRGVKYINSNSIQSITSVSNDNFKRLSESLYKFLTDLNYSEASNSLSAGSLSTGTLSVSSLMSIVNNGSKMFEVSANGYVYSKKITADDSVDTSLLRLMEKALPLRAKAGEIAFGRVNSNSGLDFWGCVPDVGWVSLTRDSGYAPGGPTSSPTLAPAWSGVVESRITALPNSPVDGDIYLVAHITDTNNPMRQYSDRLVQYIDNGWSYFDADDGSHVVVKGEGGAIYMANVSGSTTTWVKESKSVSLGPDENSDTIPYTNGLYTDFTTATTVGTAVDRFNITLKQIYDGGILPLKHIMGVAHTKKGRAYYDETTSVKFNVSAGSVFVDDIPTNATISITPSGRKQLAIKIKADLVPIAGTGYVENSVEVKHHAFQAKWTTPLPDYSAIDIVLQNSVVAGGNIFNCISPAFGSGYKVKVYDAAGVGIAASATNGWLFQYNAGILYQVDSSTATVPRYIELYYYNGELLSTTLSNYMLLAVNDKYMTPKFNVTGDNGNTGLSLSDTPRKGSAIMVFVNGAYIPVGNGDKNLPCYFSGDNGVTSKFFNDVILGDKLFWNTSKTGFNLLKTQHKVSFEYLTPTNEATQQIDQNILPFGIFVVGDTNGLEAGDFVNIYTNNGEVNVRRADASLGHVAHGYVLLDSSDGSNSKVYYSGTNDKIVLADVDFDVDADIDAYDTDLNLGHSVFLGVEGKVSYVPIDLDDYTQTDINGVVTIIAGKKPMIQNLGYVINITGTGVDRAFKMNVELMDSIELLLE